MSDFGRPNQLRQHTEKNQIRFVINRYRRVCRASSLTTCVRTSRSNLSTLTPNRCAASSSEYCSFKGLFVSIILCIRIVVSRSFAQSGGLLSETRLPCTN